MIDTPGLTNSKGIDKKHMAEMVTLIKSEKQMNAFILALNG
jgi:hypothetical protein